MTTLSDAPLALFVLYLPTTGSDGQPVSADLVAAVTERVAGFAGGCTLLATSHGAWVDGAGSVWRDEVAPLMAIAPLGPATDCFFERLAHELAACLGQRQIFIHRAPVSLVTPLITGPAPRDDQS